jgi:hypothetical protein
LKHIVLCLLVVSTTLFAGEKTPKILINDYHSAGAAGKARALRSIFSIDPARFSREEFQTIVDIIIDLNAKKSVLLAEVPERWQIAIVMQEPELKKAFPSLKIAHPAHKRHHHAKPPLPPTPSEQKGRAAAARARPDIVGRLKRPLPPLPLTEHIPEELALLIYAFSPKPDEALKYLDAHPKAMNTIDHWGSGQSHRKRNSLLMARLAMSGGGPIIETNLPLIKYLLARGVNVIHKNENGENAFHYAIANQRFFNKEDIKEILIKISDLMLEQGTSLAEFEKQILVERKGINAQIARDSAYRSPCVPGFYADFDEEWHRRAFEEMNRPLMTDYNQRLELLDVATALLEAFAAQEPLEAAGMPKELRGIVRETLVGEKKRKATLAAEENDSDKE